MSTLHGRCPKRPIDYDPVIPAITFPSSLSPPGRNSTLAEFVFKCFILRDLTATQATALILTALQRQPYNPCIIPRYSPC